MKKILLIAILATEIFAFFDNITTFEADFIQSVTDEKKKVLTYNGSLIASKPQNALWRYTSPVNKDVYINRFNVTIIEPEIEQAIIKRIESNFDFFQMIKNAKKIDKNTFIAKYGSNDFLIKTKNKFIESISYVDEFENSVKILFSKQKQNSEIDKELFIPSIPVDFDIIRD